MKTNIYSTAGVLYKEAEKCIKEKRYIKAITKYKKILKISNDSHVNSLLGACYIILTNTNDTPSNYMMAIHYYKNAIKLNSKLNDDKSILLDLSYAYIKTNNFQQAKDILYKTLDKYSSGTALEFLGYIDYMNYSE